MNTLSPRRRLLAGAFAGLVFLAACGDDEEGGDTSDAPVVTEAEVEGTDAPAPTEAAATDAPAMTEPAATEPAATEPAGTDAPEMTEPAGTEVEGTDAPGGTTAGSAAPGGDLELAAGEVFVTGSSTVLPITQRVGELANETSGGDLAVTVEGPGTGDGFATFCAGGADVTGASRAINEEETATCADAGIEFVELEVAIDGLTVATNPANEAITCLDVPALYALVGPEAEGTATWADNSELATEVESDYADVFPDAPLDISGPGEESGTYDTFVEFAIADFAEERLGEDNEFTRADYSSSPNDNLIVEGIEASESSLGWIGYAYFAAEAERMKAIEIDTGDGCVAPTPETIGDGSYGFSRSLYIYVDIAKAEANPAVASFVDLYVSEAGLATVGEAGYVDLPADRVAVTQAAWADR